MSTTSKGLAYFIVSVIAAIILIFAIFKLSISFDSIKIIVLSLSLICILTLCFLFYAALKNSKVISFPLGLTSGSVRALIAVLVLMFFVGVALIFYFKISADNSSNGFDLAKEILTTLGTLVIAVSSFYFGSKATEQGSKIASDAFDKAVKAKADVQSSLPANNSTANNTTATPDQQNTQNDNEEEVPVEVDINQKSQDTE